MRVETAGIRSTPAWLAAAVRSALRNRLRSERRKKAREARAAEDLERPATQDLAARRELLQLVDDAVQKLTEPSREAILRRYYQGQSARQISSEWNVPLATVRSRVRRGIEALRRELRHTLEEDLRGRLAVHASPRPVAAPAELRGGRPGGDAPVRRSSFRAFLRGLGDVARGRGSACLASGNPCRRPA